jgi:hypothetical protein
MATVEVRRLRNGICVRVDVHVLRAACEPSEWMDAHGREPTCAAHTELPYSRRGELSVSKSMARIMIIVCSAWREVRSLSNPLG